MRISILSRKSELYSTRRLLEAAESRGHEARVQDPFKFTIHVENPPKLLFLSKPFPLPDAVIPRIGASITYFGTALIRQFEQMGVFTLSSSRAVNASRDKLYALQLLSKQNILLPKTAFVRRKSEILKTIDEIGGAPVVIKLLEGTQGIGVVLAERLNTAQAIIELLHVAKQNILVQKFVEEAKGRDIRAFVVGDRVVAAMRRVSENPSEFRSNVHRGGRAESIQLPKEFEEVSVRAAKTLGLKVAGVDLLESKEGPAIIEVNSSPGLEAIENVSGVDIAAEIIQFIEQNVGQV